MKQILRILALTVLGVAAWAPAQTVQLNIGDYGYNCGHVTTNNYCYGIPTVTVDGNGNVIGHGSIWLDAQPTNPNTGYDGFIVVNGVNYPIASPFIPLQVSPGVHTLTYTFGAGTITLSYSSYYSRGGGGRGGGGAGYIWTVQKAGSSITLN